MEGKMNAYSGYNNYKTQSIYTMTKGELLILLYDEMIKRLLKAELSLDKKEYVDFERDVDRVRDIILYLKDTLNFRFEISFELERMYDFFLMHIARIKAGRRKELITEMRPLIMDLRDAYQQAEKVAVY